MTINRALGRTTTMGAGWRYFMVDYRNGDLLYDLELSGPLATVRVAL